MARPGARTIVWAGERMRLLIEGRPNGQSGGGVVVAPVRPGTGQVVPARRQAPPVEEEEPVEVEK